MVKRSWVKRENKVMPIPKNKNERHIYIQMYLSRKSEGKGPKSWFTEEISLSKLTKLGDNFQIHLNQERLRI